MGYQASHRAVKELKDEGPLPPRTEVRLLCVSQ
jgi:hypothetical protein